VELAPEQAVQEVAVVAALVVERMLTPELRQP
jgi:hypothetical protein